MDACPSVPSKTRENLQEIKRLLSHFRQIQALEKLIFKFVNMVLRVVQSELSRVLELCQDEMSIKTLQERLPGEDPVIVTTAIYTLLHKGMLVSNDMLERRLSLQTSVRPK